MSKWLPIESAPKDGTTIRYRRVYNGRVTYEGKAEWRSVTFGALHDSQLPYDYAKAYDATGWMYPAGVCDKRVPEPTHWKPVSQEIAR